MKRGMQCLGWSLLLAGCTACVCPAQTKLSWDEVKVRFAANNPVLRAGQLGVDESKANEITAYLRPNPTATILVDQIDPFA